MATVDDTPTLQYPPPLDPSRTENGLPSSSSPSSTTTTKPTTTLTTPILIVGGGPVGMLTALLLARLHRTPSVILEREPGTTAFPKMEYTNGRSMEIYRAMDLHGSLRAMATAEVPEEAGNDELIVTSLGKGGKWVHTWKRDGAREQRERWRRVGGEGGNDGRGYVEPHLRCHQILMERWLRERVEEEKGLIRGFWGCGFVGLEEKGEEGVVVSEAVKEGGERLLIRSEYVVGCDGGGSWVRKAVGLESKRNYLELTMAFAHFRSASLRASVTSFPRFWHANVIGGGILVSQNERDLWTAHYMMPPGMDPAGLTADEVVALAVGGCQGPQPVEVDEMHCRGMWRVEVAIADAFRSKSSGRVFLAGDAAHQLSPVGGHGLNSGVADAFDLCWKLAAVRAGWGGEGLLGSYDAERRQIAFENLEHVQQALVEIGLPIFNAHLKYGADVLEGDSEEGERTRKEHGEACKEGHWLHDQNGNILGYRYKGSSVVCEEGEVGEAPKGTNEVYIPTTWPGARAPHVWMANAGTKESDVSTLDELSHTGFTVIDFSVDGGQSRPFVAAAEELSVPLKVSRWHGEENVRKVYERDVLLVRPDMHVAWRGKEGQQEPVGVEEARRIVQQVAGRAQ